VIFKKKKILLLIVPNQKVVFSVLFKVVVHGGECIPVSIGPNGGCVPVDTSTLKSVEVQNGGLRVEEILPWRL